MTQQRTPTEVLRAVPLFRGLSDRHLNKLVKMSREVPHAPGHVVADEGAAAHAFHVVLSGTAHVTIGGQERRTLHPGDYFGEISLIDGRPRSATVTASADEPMRTLAIFRGDFNQLLEDDPTFARTLLVQLCERVRALEAAAH